MGVGSVEEHGVVHRPVYAEAPPKVEYCVRRPPHGKAIFPLVLPRGLPLCSVLCVRSGKPRLCKLQQPFGLAGRCHAIIRRGS
ncbi:MAG: winged helix-turn-helix transcriptional regulator [Gemmataceae bacterium]